MLIPRRKKVRKSETNCEKSMKISDAQQIKTNVNIFYSSSKNTKIRSIKICNHFNQKIDVKV
jgi:hypothetical protein